jgi:hypothetical protein
MTTLELMNSRKDNLMKVVRREPAKWVPLISINSFGAFGYAGKSYWELEHDYDGLPKAYGKVYSVLPADASTGDTPSFNGRADEIMEGHAQYKVTTDGYNLQHLQNSKMLETDYPVATPDIHKFNREVMLPRKFPFLFEMEPEAAAEKLIALMKEANYVSGTGPVSKIKQYIEDTYGIYHFTDKLHRVSTPGDVLFDLYRGFKGSLTDLRRHYEEMKAFCDALWDQKFCMHYDGSPLDPEKFPAYMAHIPAFLNAKQYGDLCFKYYRQQVGGIYAGGSRNFLLAEGSWSHLFDYFKDLPKDSVLMSLENDDVIESKKILGDYQIILGGSKMCDLRLATEQECIDKAKAVIDACAPQGGYMFTTDKAWCCNGDITPNLIAVYNFVHEYAKY